MHGLPEKPSKRWPYLFPAVLSAALLFLASLLPSDRQWPQGDLLDYFVPVGDWVGERFSNGELPLWNPEVACGLDQFSTIQAGIFYPPNLVYFFFEGGMAQLVLTFVHLVIASIGMQAWLSSNDRTRGGALIGSAAFLFGIIGEAWWPPMLYTLAWIPWLLFAIDSDELRVSTQFSIGTAAIALQILAGFPQQVLYSAMLVFSYCLVKAVVTRKKELVIGACAVVALGGMIAAAQLVPSYFYSKETWRPGILQPEHVHYNRNFAKVESKSPIGDVRELARQTTQLFGYDPDDNPQMLSSRFFGYAGFLIPLAVGMALLSRWSWRTAFFSVAAAGAMLLSQGFLAWLPLYDALTQTIPFFGTFRTPSRLLMIVLLACCALAAAGATEFLRKPANEKDRRWHFAKLAVVFGITLAVSALRYRDLFVQTAIFLALVAGILVIIARSKEEKSLWPRASGWMIYGILLVDLWMASSHIFRHLDPDFRTIQLSESTSLSDEDIAPLAEKVGKNRLYLTGEYWPVMRTRHSPQWRGLSFYEPAITERHFMLNSAIKFPGQMPKQSHFSYHDVPVVPHLRFFDQCSVELIVSEEAIENAADHGWNQVSGTGHFVYENARCTDRVSLFSEYRIATSDEASAWLLEVADPTAGDQLLLEEAPSEQWRQAKATHNGESPRGTITWITEKPELLEIDVEATQPSLMLLTDSWAPGWTCLVDGKPRQILRANYLFRCVELLPGDRRVTFQYSPPGLLLGIAISVCALLATVLLILWLRRKA